MRVVIKTQAQRWRRKLTELSLRGRLRPVQRVVEGADHAVAECDHRRHVLAFEQFVRSVPHAGLDVEFAVDPCSLQPLRILDVLFVKQVDVTDSDPANVTAARSCAVRLPIRASQRAVRLAAYTLAPSRYRSFH